MYFRNMYKSSLTVLEEKSAVSMKSIDEYLFQISKSQTVRESLFTQKSTLFTQERWCKHMNVKCRC